MKLSSSKIIEIIGIAAVVLSLIFVGYELRQSTSVARSDAYGNFSSLLWDLASNVGSDVRLSNLFAQVNQGALPEDFTPEEQMSIRAFQGGAVRIWESLFRSVQAGILPEETLETAGAGIVLNNDYFKHTWSSIKQLHTDDFIAYFESLPWNE